MVWIFFGINRLLRLFDQFLRRSEGGGGLCNSSLHGYSFLVLTFSVVANGSSLAYVKKRGASPSTLRLSHLCDLALDQMNAKTR